MQDLVTRWRSEADTVERCGHESTGKLIRRLVGELEEALRDDQDETLKLPEAALESGYSLEHLRKMVASGKIPNAGAKGRPLIRRGDLPNGPANPKGRFGSPEDDARSFLSRSGNTGNTPDAPASATPVRPFATGVGTRE